MANFSEVLAHIEVTLDCGATIGFTTDRTWKFSLDVPDRFEDPGFRLVVCRSARTLRVQPWGDIPTQGAQGE